MTDSLEERVARAIAWADDEDYMEDYRLYHKRAAAIAECDPIDTATGLTWKERFLERAERCAQAEVERDGLKLRGAWQPISEAKTDGTVYPVWVAPYQGLDGFLTACGYHPDAGWCADELREVTHFVDCPLTPPDKRQAKERRVVDAGGLWVRPRQGVSIRMSQDRRIADRRKAQPETSEVE